MPTKDRLHEIKNTSTNDEDTNSPSDNNSNIVSTDEQEILHHVIGSGGRLADFFDKVEQISIAIDSVKKNVDEVRNKQRQMLETTDNRKLQEEVNDRQSDIKNIVNSRIRSKVIFVI